MREYLSGKSTLCYYYYYYCYYYYKPRAETRSCD